MYLHTSRPILVLALLTSSQLTGSMATWAPDEVSQQQNASRLKAPTGLAIEMLSDSEGVDFNSYLHEAYLSVKKNWFANMPPSVEKGQQGTNTVEMRVLQDGSVPKDFLKMVRSSEKSDFDRASLQGISDAIPFRSLPEAFSKSYIVLRFTFYYNLPPPKNPH